MSADGGADRDADSDTERITKFPLRLNQLGKRAAGPAATFATPAKVLPAASAVEAQRAPKLQATAAAARAVLRPQRLLEHAHADAARKVAPSGLGLDSADVRLRMVERLRRDGVKSEIVLSAMARVPRHLFVDAGLVTQAYEDTSLPIGHGQTISKPSVVARMIELLTDGKNARQSAQQNPRQNTLGQTLEIGTGCGYQAAVLAQLARQVISVERLSALHDKARLLLAPLQLSNLRLVYGDGMIGHAPNAPYDSIIAAAGGDALPPEWLAQLAIGGRLVSPVREVGGARQILMVVDRTETGFTQQACEAVRFVPLKSGLVS